jgi:hypothetical protein
MTSLRSSFELVREAVLRPAQSLPFLPKRRHIRLQNGRFDNAPSFTVTY